MSSIFDLSWILKSNSFYFFHFLSFLDEKFFMHIFFHRPTRFFRNQKMKFKANENKHFLLFSNESFQIYFIYIIYISNIHIYIDIVIYYINIVLQTKHTYILINIYKQLKYFKNIFSIYLKYICLQINIYWNKIQWTISNENLSMMEQ